MASQPRRFHGFPLELLHFMHELQANNNREWFAANKSRFEQVWLEPALDFIAAMEQPVRRLSPAFLAVPKRVGGSLMRIYRDTRFSADKRPYKTNLGIQFRHKAGKDVHAPGIYFHLDTEQPFLGVGLWRPDREALAAIRQAMVKQPAGWEKCCRSAAFRRDFDRVGESLQRIPRGYDADSPLAEELRRKDHIAVNHLSIDECLSPDLPKLLAKRMQVGQNYLRWLCEALELEFD